MTGSSVRTVGGSKVAVRLSGLEWLMCEETGSRGGYRKNSVHKRVFWRYLCFEKSSYDLTLWNQYQQQKHRPCHGSSNRSSSRLPACEGRQSFHQSTA